MPPKEMPEWFWALADSDLLSPVDVRTFVDAGLSPADVSAAPEDLTPLEIIRHIAGDSFEGPESR
ncbi:MAG: hypothetical protein JJU45_08100 [Acidimicrobiia bacterium]|nr:hypothetical protein [Acidimicrobiia bacterium]